MKVKISGNRDIIILGIVKALKEYGNIVEEELKVGNFSEILISITEEEIDGIRNFLKAPFEISLDDLEIMYENLMKNFGETSIPPEAYVRAIKFGDENGIPVHGIDIPDGVYEDLYIKLINITDLISLSLRKNRLYKRKWKIDNPEDTSIEWDNAVSKGGFKKLETEREIYMAERIYSSNADKIIAIVEIERFNGIMNHLKSQMPEYKFQMI